MKFATYFHPETSFTTKPINEIEWIGSLPDFLYVRDETAKHLKFKNYPVIQPNKVSINEFLSVHDKQYVDDILLLSKDIKEEGHEITISIECHGFYYFIPGYEYGLGGMYSAIDLMKKGDLDRAYCWSLPSHHSYLAKGHGFCLLNTEAAAVRYAQKQGFKNILIIDWDFHHGDGTQTIFANDSTVHQISIHSALDMYMSMMKAEKLATTVYGESVGHQNIPVLDKMYTEEFFREVGMEGKFYRADGCMKAFEEALSKIPFKPDMIFIFDGHDAHKKDLGKDVTGWDYEDYNHMTRLIIEFSLKNGCPIISTPGGGYNVRTAIQSSNNHADLLATYKV